MTHPLFKKEIFVETAFARRFQKMLQEGTDERRLQYDHPLGLCLAAAGRGDTIPDARKHSISPIQRGCNFVAARDNLAPFCRVASHTSAEVRAILSTLEQEYQP